MSDGAMILLVFGLIILPVGGMTAIALLIVKRIRAHRERTYTGRTVGTIVRVRPGNIDRPTIVYVRYEVDGTAYECHETVKLTNKAIRIGPIPIGQRKHGKIPSSAGCTVPVAYLPEDPSKAILVGNSGLVNV